MENNKTYLQRIHWAAVIALLFYVVIAILFGADGMFDSPNSFFRSIEAGSIACPFIGIGAVTRNWKATSVAGIAAMAIYFIDQNILLNIRLNETYRFVLLLLYPLILALLVILHTGRTGKAVMVFLLCIVASRLGGGQLAALFESFDMLRHFSIWSAINLACYVGVFVSYVIFVCEIINFSKGKALFGKTRLLNLGNIYPRNNTIVAFWCIKGAMWSHLINGMRNFESIMKRFQRAGSETGNFFSDFTIEKINFYHYLSAIITTLSWIAAGLLLAWYLRKFVLETFIHFNLESKLIYWLSFLPFIGFFFFLFNVGSSWERQLYEEKRNGIAQFAYNNPVSITAVFLTLVSIRLIIQLNKPDTVGLISLVVTAILFLWMTREKTGFYVYLGLNLLALAFGLVIMFFAKQDPNPISFLVTSVLIGAMQLIYVFPAYHFEEFEYIPTEDPGPETTEADGEFHLFPIIK